MEFPPEDWTVFEADDFGTAAPRSPGELGMDLLAQARPNGRIMDHWRLALGGSEILDVEVDLKTLLPSTTAYPNVKLIYQQFPASIEIRRNMTSGAWMDVLDLLKANEIIVRGDNNESNNDVVRTLEELAGDKNFTTSSIRWAVCASEAGLMELQLQCLAASAKYLTGKPTFKR